VGQNTGSITMSYSSGSVRNVGGDSWPIGLYIGGLVGDNRGSIVASHSDSSVMGIGWGGVGGLVGRNYDGSITTSYSSGSVSGTSSVGGLVGSGSPLNVSACVWDTETSGVSISAGGVGLTTAEMMDPEMLGLNGFANDPNWVLDAGRDYPRLAWQGTPGQIIPELAVDWLAGQGTVEVPYRIDTADQLILLGKASILWNRHFVLGADIDLDPTLPGRAVFAHAVIPVFTGVLDGRGHVISNLRIERGSYVGLFGHLAAEAEVRNVGVVDVNITNCSYAGGLVGCNYGGSITASYSRGSVSGDAYVGGLVGSNGGSVTNCYNSASVNGTQTVGGLVGGNSGRIATCYSSGSVSGTYVGGLVGSNYHGSIAASFWDTHTSGRTWSAGGTGKTTAEMQTTRTFLDAGWDFVGETANGTENIWWILEGKDYPRLWWELDAEETVSP